MMVELEPLFNGLLNNLDVFLINTSVFFFASNFLQTGKNLEKELEAISTSDLSWELVFSFKEHPGEDVTPQSVEEHPDWVINYDGKGITSKEYFEWRAYQDYNEGYETRLASERKARWMALYGSMLLILGSYIAIYKTVDYKSTAILILSIYVLAALLIVGLFSILVKHFFKIRPQPKEPDFVRQSDN